MIETRREKKERKKMCLLEAEKMKLQEALRNRNLIVYLCWLMRDDDSLNF